MSVKEKLLYFPLQTFSPRFGDRIFTIDMVSYRTIQDEHACCNKTIVVYKVVVKRGKKEWFVEKRFSEFIQLWNSLPLSPRFHLLKLIPLKTWFHIVSDDDFLFSRQEALLKALDESLRDLSSTNSLSQSPILDFLLVEKDT